MRAAKVQASLRICAVSPEPPLLAHPSSESRGPFRQKARSLAPLNGWTCAVKICHDGLLEDTNSLDASHFVDYLMQTTKYKLKHMMTIKFKKYPSSKVHPTCAFQFNWFPLHRKNVVKHGILVSTSILSFLGREIIKITRLGTSFG